MKRRRKSFQVQYEHLEKEIHWVEFSGWQDALRYCENILDYLSQKYDEFNQMSLEDAVCVYIYIYIYIYVDGELCSCHRPPA